MSFLGMLIPNSTWIFTQKFSDDFNRSNRALDGDNGWVASTGTGIDTDIVANEVQIEDNDVNYRGGYQSGSLPTDADEYAEANISNNDNIGPVIRGNWITNVGGRFNQGYFGHFAAGSYRLGRADGFGTGTTIGSAGGPGLGNHVVRVAAIGKEIRLYVNDILLIVAVDTAHGALGRQGVLMEPLLGTREADDYAHGDASR